MFKDSDPRSQVRMTVIVMQTTVCKPDLLEKLYQQLQRYMYKKDGMKNLVALMKKNPLS